MLSSGHYSYTPMDLLVNLLAFYLIHILSDTVSLVYEAFKDYMRQEDHSRLVNVNRKIQMTKLQVFMPPFPEKLVVTQSFVPTCLMSSVRGRLTSASKGSDGPYCYIHMTPTTKVLDVFNACLLHPLTLGSRISLHPR